MSFALACHAILVNGVIVRSLDEKPFFKLSDVFGALKVIFRLPRTSFDLL